MKTTLRAMTSVIALAATALLIGCSNEVDIGIGDSTAIWFAQRSGSEIRLIDYYEASGETLAHFAKYLQDTGYIFGRHYLPHDAAHRRLSDTNKSIEEMLHDLGVTRTEIVPRIDNELDGITMVRAVFSQCWFDAEGTADGLKRLGGFKKQWNKTLGAWRNEPADDDNCHGADAFRQFAQALQGGLYVGASSSGRKKSGRRANWRTA